MQQTIQECVFAELARNRGLCILNSREMANMAMPEVRLIYPYAVMIEWNRMVYIAATKEARNRLKNYLAELLLEKERRIKDLRRALQDVEGAEGC